MRVKAKMDSPPAFIASFIMSSSKKDWEIVSKTAEDGKAAVGWEVIY